MTLDRLHPNCLRQIYDTIWAESMASSMARIMCEMAVDDNKEITAPGPNRLYLDLGPRRSPHRGWPSASTTRTN